MRKIPISFVINENNCFVCTSHKKNLQGYSIMTGGSVHRFIYEQCFGEIPKRMCVCHKCDNRACINPEHLFLGTQKDNIKDMISKNRQAKGSKKWLAKLNEKTVLEIKKTNILTAKEIAKKYKVSLGTIYDIKNNKSWKHVGKNIEMKISNMALGENQHCSKLKEEDIIKIRNEYKNIPSRKLARMFNVCKTTILKIKNNKNWKWVIQNNTP